MSEETGGPALEPTLLEWLRAREETQAHLSGAMTSGGEGWAQRLADLLATEGSWQAQYTELVGQDSPEHRFPPSNR